MSNRVVVLGLDCAAPELVFDRFAGELPNLSRLRSNGVWGRLESVIPAITVPAWACSMTSQDPGQLGIYGFRNRKDHTYDGLTMANATQIQKDAVWDFAGRQGRRSILVGVPPSFPPKPVEGVRVGCFLTPSIASEYTYPPELRDEIASLVGDYKIDVDDFRSEDKARILADARDMAEKRFKLFRHFLRTKPWDFAMMVEIGVDRVHHGFWKYFDEAHPKHEPGPLQRSVLDYYIAVDQEVGATLEEIGDDVTVIIMSDHGAQPMMGGVCINEWLRREGYLTLREEPAGMVSWSHELVDWSKTKVWSDGGYYARIFLNVRGREPQGVIEPDQVEAFRQEIIDKLEAMVDHRGTPMGNVVFKPENIYRETRNVPPDLIVYFGNLAWRSVGSVGGGDVYTFENDTGPDDANHAQFGIFIMTGDGIAPAERTDLKITDVGPTVMHRMGLPVPDQMIGKVIA